MYELDVFIPSLNLAIEYHGLYYHSHNYIETKEEKYKHFLKADICGKNDVKLIQIFEDEWLFKKDLIKSILKSKLGIIKNKIYARNCNIVELSNNDFNKFCNDNHVQGYLNSKIKLGLVYLDKIVSVIGFNKKNEIYECTRFCNLQNTVVIGGASKLFFYFKKRYNPKIIITFADRRYSNGELYQKLGFKLIGITNPGYFYIKNLNRYNRTLFQKHKLQNKLENFDQKLSEAQNMFNNGFRRIWDAGHYKFVYENNNFR